MYKTTSQRIIQADMGQESHIKLIEKAKKLPDSPGVYFFLNEKKKILYIGKATSLRDRVRSYFGGDLEVARGVRLVQMVREAVSIDYRQTDSVLEALLLEASLIKSHQPVYNAREKDDKSYSYVLIVEEEFPRVLLVRGRNVLKEYSLEEIKYVFGPFPQGGALREALKIVRKIFPYRDNKCIPANAQIASGKTPRPCFNRQIGLCPGVCTGEVGKREYGRTVEHIRLFFEGRKRELVKKLEREMKRYAQLQEFEKAQKVKRTLFSLEHIHDVSVIKEDLKEEIGHPGAGRIRIEAYDIAHISGSDTVGVMVVVQSGEADKAEYRKFKIYGNESGEVNDIKNLKEVLRRRLKHTEWQYPQLVVVDGGDPQINAARTIFDEFGHNIPIVSVVKDEHHRPKDVLGNLETVERYKKEILLAHSEAHRFAIAFHRNRRRKSSGLER